MTTTSFYMRCLQAELINILRRMAKDKRTLTFHPQDPGSDAFYLNMQIDSVPTPVRVILKPDGTWAMETVIEFTGLPE